MPSVKNFKRFGICRKDEPSIAAWYSSYARSRRLYAPWNVCCAWNKRYPVLHIINIDRNSRRTRSQDHMRKIQTARHVFILKLEYIRCRMTILKKGTTVKYLCSSVVVVRMSVSERHCYVISRTKAARKRKGTTICSRQTHFWTLELSRVNSFDRCPACNEDSNWFHDVLDDLVSNFEMVCIHTFPQCFPQDC